MEAGTGAVHTAPAHGVDDYIVGQKYGLPVENPVGTTAASLLRCRSSVDYRVEGQRGGSSGTRDERDVAEGRGASA